MLKIYNTLTRKKEIFTPLNHKQVRIYVCGVTVYDYCHIGHARVMVVFDIIARWLRASGYSLEYVRNITDIDDKIIAVAQKNNVHYREIADCFTHTMHEDAAALSVLPPDREPRATEYIPQIITMIAALVDKKKAYVAANGDVYYRVKTFPAYGQLSGKNPDELHSGERVEINTAKEDALDFVLWKSAKPNEPAWDSPWGKGRPGWHIECSAMSAALLGETFDIHGGGMDLEFPHHENELAQSCAVIDHFALKTEGIRPIRSHVKYWIHNGFIQIRNEKMSKSLGNFFTIREVLKQYPAEAVRLFLLRTHYRSPINYSDAHLQEAKNALNRLYTVLRMTSPANIEGIDYKNNFYAARFREVMDQDFNTAEAIAVLFELASEINKTRDHTLAGYLKALASLLGLLQQDIESYFQEGQQALDHQAIEKLIAQRNSARAKKDWAQSDAIRDQLLNQGIILEDQKGITTWRKK